MRLPAGTAAKSAVRPAAEERLSTGDRARINLSWLVRLRWGAAVGQLAMIAVASSLLGLELQLAPLYALVAIELASNLACWLWLHRRRRVPEWLTGALMGLDVLLLTGLFSWSGGASNPFSSLYLVNIALGAVVLRPAWTWSLVGLSLLCFAALFWQPLLGAPPGAEHMHLMGHGGDLWLHLEGMWVAFGVGASFIVYFVQRVTRALASREHELAEALAANARAERLASLATLAAGAAHELSTPLSTIAVVAKELERELLRLSAQEAITGDVRLIREQVERCREILLQMAADAGESTGEDFVAVSVETLADAALRELAERERVHVTVAPSTAGHRLVIPIRAAGQALRAIVKNGLHASPPDAAVEVQAAVADGAFRIEVRDRGRGMSAEVLARACEPFFTTKPTGKGMGLGLFLARDVIERIGGRLALRSREGAGTTVTLWLPAAPSDRARDARASSARAAA